MVRRSHNDIPCFGTGTRAALYAITRAPRETPEKALATRHTQGPRKQVPCIPRTAWSLHITIGVCLTCLFKSTASYRSFQDQTSTSSRSNSMLQSTSSTATDNFSCWLFCTQEFSKAPPVSCNGRSDDTELVSTLHSVVPQARHIFSNVEDSTSNFLDDISNTDSECD